MRKQVTLLSGLALLAGTAFAQQNIPTKQAKLSKIAVSKGIENKKNEGVLKAGGDLLWSDPFDGTHVWTVGTGGQGTFILGDNSHAQITNATSGLTPYMGAMASTTAANGFAFFNGVQYLIGGAVDPQNTWVASEVIDFTGIQTISLTFEQRYRAFNSDVTYVEFSTDGGANWTFSEAVNVAVPTNGASAQNMITLDLPVGGTATGMVRFRWENLSDDDAFGSGYGWMVDDVNIYEGYGDNVSLMYTYSAVGVQELQYSKFPLTQAATAGNISFGAEFKNVGYNSQDASLHVTSGAYDATGSAVTTPAFTVDSVEILTIAGKPMPTVAGAADFTFEITAAGSLDVTADDSKTVPFEVTPYVYAVDSYDGTAASMEGSFEGWQSGTGDPAIGTMYEIFEDGEIGSIDIGIGEVDVEADYIGREFLGLIYKLNEGNGEFEYYDETDVKALEAAHFGSLVKMQLTTTIPVDAGLYLVMAGSFDGSPVPFAFSGMAPAGTTTGLNGATVTGLASDPATPNIVEAPIVRIDFQSYVGVNELENVAGISASPNPFTNATEISFDLKADAEVSIVVTDLAGRVVMTIPTANYNAGAQKVSIDGAALNAGVYNYTLTVGNNVVTKRIVKK
ncbi:MAG: hypothetical protein A3D31_14465 [Candidatus Fluviicola riflensis]|nr:MAG: hypothetical protein CHH17_18900 [Candidatus Fluviicola riflensis]OGS78172.1 MAG: hypothetical protein A3D31_14465 [Candidatus Fluviicola riflensis]OGS85238.1 MAG: hypothetical protein A2724_11400 [Fluviicola sp. RIFCSPHIGHO2_01_FULL_43_53]OGS89509.1 MAG: hypothetical protein A3E30_05705 [Fluviicola sp. RIFCSPHIGHO2_12_FULL_43_24]